MPTQAGTWEIDPSEDSQVLRFTPANSKVDDSTKKVPEPAETKSTGKKRTKEDVADSEPKLRRTRETVLQRQKTAVEGDDETAGPYEVGKEKETDRTKTSADKRSKAKKEETQQKKTKERPRGSKEAEEIPDRNEETDVKYVEELISDDEKKDAESRGAFKDFGVDWVSS